MNFKEYHTHVESNNDIVGVHSSDQTLSFLVRRKQDSVEVTILGRTTRFSVSKDIFEFIRDNQYNGEALLQCLIPDPDVPRTVFCPSLYVSLLTYELNNELSRLKELARYDTMYLEGVLGECRPEELKKRLQKEIECELSISTFAEANNVFRSLGLTSRRAETLCSKINPCILYAVNVLRYLAFVR